MAARPTTSALVMVSMAIIAVIALALFVTTIVFASNAQRLQRELTQAESDRNEAVTAREMDLFQRLSQAAGNQSVVGYLNENYESVADLAVGQRNRSPEDIRNAFDEMLGQGQYDNLQSAVSALVSQNQGLGEERDNARRAAERDRLALTQAEDQLAAVRQEFQDAFEQQRSTVGVAFDNASEYSADLEELTAQFEDDTDRLRREATEISRQKDREINRLRDDIARLEAKIATLERDELKLLPDNEAALVDATVVGTDLSSNEVFISLGRGDKLIRGLTFEVYNDAASVRADPQGNYPPGKATVEITRIDQDTSVARVLRSTRGDRIQNGDILVNAIYDPAKEYEFVVFGNFDTDGDFIATPQETNRIRAIIQEWGGSVSDELTGTTDFVVLGDRPIPPPEPRLDDPPAIVQRYAEARRELLKYEDLRERATNTFIPILNQNRLFTLTGIDRR